MYNDSVFIFTGNVTRAYAIEVLIDARRRNTHKDRIKVTETG
jgi:hypothetical protein